MEKCQSLKVLSLADLLDMDENHCRVLGAYSRLDLEIHLSGCRIIGAAAAVLAEVLEERNQGSTLLHDCDIDNFVLADELRGNSRLRSLSTRFSRNLEDGNREVLAIAGALRENKGLVEWKLVYSLLSNERWDAIFDSLKTHPTLEVLNLRSSFCLTDRTEDTYSDYTTAPPFITSRIQALLDMMKMNLSIHTIYLHDRYSENELYRESVIPYLVTNRFLPRVRAIQKARPNPYRDKVLGRALLSARTDANSFWMLLSGNAEVAFPPRTTTIAAAANLPTPATVATFTARVAAVAASAVSALTSAATSCFASALNAFAPTVTAAANVAPSPSADQKRKANVNHPTKNCSI